MFLFNSINDNKCFYFTLIDNKYLGIYIYDNMRIYSPDMIQYKDFVYKKMYFILKNDNFIIDNLNNYPSNYLNYQYFNKYYINNYLKKFNYTVSNYILFKKI